MSHQAVGQLIDRWLNEPEFRKKLKKDPVGTVKATGVKLEEEEMAVLKKIDWSLSDEELKTRINNSF